MLQISKWDLDVETDDEEEYTSLVRAIRRTYQRFKLLFVSCSPSQGEKIRGDLMADVPTKKYELLDIKESIDNLYEAINNIPNLPELDVLFIRGLEYSIFEYEDQEFGDISKRSQSNVYGGSWAGVPPVLAKLNMQRELFRDRFPHICFVFLLPHFAVDYFIRRAPDFYDWKSGIYRFKTDSEDLRSQATAAWKNLNTEEKLAKIREVKACLDEVIDPDTRVQLLFQLGRFYIADSQFLPALNAFNCSFQIRQKNYIALYICGILLSELGRHEEAIVNYDLSLEIKPDNDAVWHNRGIALASLGRYEEAIASYDLSLEIKPDNDAVWHNRGIALGNLGRHEDAIASWDRTVEINTDKDEAWWGRGIALASLGRYEEATTSYDRSLELKPDRDEAWHNLGNALGSLGRYEEAIASYDRSLELKPDRDEAWHNRGRMLGYLGRHGEELDSYDRSIEIKPNRDEAWYNRGISLSELGRYEDAIYSYNRSLELKPNRDESWHNKGICLYQLGRYQDSLNAYEQAINIKPDKHDSWHDKGFVLFHIGNYAEALTPWQQAFNIISKTKPSDTSDLIQEFLDEQLLSKFQQPAVRDILPQLLTIYTTAQVLPELGVALTRNLKAIQSATISDYTAIEWLTMWQELGKPHSELALALRMLEAGIKYKQNPNDDRVFLSLPQEMRPLLREALGLEH
jgi:tetratricopeptide (TPR) repeat protein